MLTARSALCSSNSSQQMKLIPLMANSLDGLIKIVGRGNSEQNPNGLMIFNKWRCLMDLTWMAHEIKFQVMYYSE